MPKKADLKNLRDLKSLIDDTSRDEEYLQAYRETLERENALWARRRKAAATISDSP